MLSGAIAVIMRLTAGGDDVERAVVAGWRVAPGEGPRADPQAATSNPITNVAMTRDSEDRADIVTAPQLVSSGSIGQSEKE